MSTSSLHSLHSGKLLMDSHTPHLGVIMRCDSHFIRLSCNTFISHHNTGPGSHQTLTSVSVLCPHAAAASFLCLTGCSAWISLFFHVSAAVINYTLPRWQMSCLDRSLVKQRVIQWFYEHESLSYHQVPAPGWEEVKQKEGWLYNHWIFWQSHYVTIMSHEHEIVS